MIRGLIMILHWKLTG